MLTSRRKLGVAILAAALLAPVGAADAAPTVAPCVRRDPATTGYSANLVDHTINVIDLVRNEIVDEIDGFRFPWNVEVSPDGSKLFVDDAPVARPAKGAVLVVDTCTHDITKRIPTLAAAFSTISPDRTSVFATNLMVAGVQQIDTATAEVVRTYLTLPLAQEAVTADNKTLWVVGLPGQVYAIDMRTGLLDGLPFYPGLLPAQFTISPDGSTLGIANLEGQVAIVDTATRTVRKRIDLGPTSYPSFAAMAPDNRHLWVGCYSGKVAVIDLDTDRVVKTLDTGGWVAGVSFTGDAGTAYISTTPTGSVRPALGAAYLVPVLLSRWHAGGRIRVVDTNTFEETAVIRTGNVPMKLSLP